MRTRKRKPPVAAGQIRKSPKRDDPIGLSLSIDGGFPGRKILDKTTNNSATVAPNPRRFVSLSPKLTAAQRSLPSSSMLEALPSSRSQAPSSTPIPEDVYVPPAPSSANHSGSDLSVVRSSGEQNTSQVSDEQIMYESQHESHHQEEQIEIEHAGVHEFDQDEEHELGFDEEEPVQHEDVGFDEIVEEGQEEEVEPELDQQQFEESYHSEPRPNESIHSRDMTPPPKQHEPPAVPFNTSNNSRNPRIGSRSTTPTRPESTTPVNRDSKLKQMLMGYTSTPKGTGVSKDFSNDRERARSRLNRINSRLNRSRTPPIIAPIQEEVPPGVANNRTRSQPRPQNRAGVSPRTRIGIASAANTPDNVPTNNRAVSSPPRYEDESQGPKRRTTPKSKVKAKAKATARTGYSSLSPKSGVPISSRSPPVQAKNNYRTPPRTRTVAGPSPPSTGRPQGGTIIRKSPQTERKPAKSPPVVMSNRRSPGTEHKPGFKPKVHRGSDVSRPITSSNKKFRDEMDTAASELPRGRNSSVKALRSQTPPANLSAVSSTAITITPNQQVTPQQMVNSRNTIKRPRARPTERTIPEDRSVSPAPINMESAGMYCTPFDKGESKWVSNSMMTPEEMRSSKDFIVHSRGEDTHERKNSDASSHLPGFGRRSLCGSVRNSLYGGVPYSDGESPSCVQSPALTFRPQFRDSIPGDPLAGTDYERMTPSARQSFSKIEIGANALANEFLNNKNNGNGSSAQDSCDRAVLTYYEQLQKDRQAEEMIQKEHTPKKMQSVTTTKAYPGHGLGFDDLHVSPRLEGPPEPMADSRGATSSNANSRGSGNNSANATVGDRDGRASQDSSKGAAERSLSTSAVIWHDVDDSIHNSHDDPLARSAPISDLIRTDKPSARPPLPVPSDTSPCKPAMRMALRTSRDNSMDLRESQERLLEVVSNVDKDLPSLNDRLDQLKRSFQSRHQIDDSMRSSYDRRLSPKRSDPSAGLTRRWPATPTRSSYIFYF